MKILATGAIQFVRCFREMGFEVRALLSKNMVEHEDDVICNFYSDPSGLESQVISEVDKFKPDLIFQGDHSGPLIHFGLERFTIPKVWYSIDSHLHGAWHKHYAVLFDKVFCAQQNLVSLLSTYQSEVEWLPLFCDRSVSFVPWDKRFFPVSFVGNIDSGRNPLRAKLFDEVKRIGISINCLTGDFIPVYSRSKIVINQSVNDDLNLRFFEASGCGALLITDELSHSMNDILEPGVDFLVYKAGNAESLVEKIRWAQSHDRESEEMAQRAHSKIVSAHMEHHRATRVLDWFTLRANERRERDQGRILSHLSWAFDHCSQLELPASVTSFFAQRAFSYALEARGYDHGRDRSNLILAGRALQQGEYSDARKLLLQISEEKMDKEFRLRFFQYGVLAGALDKNFQEASRILSRALEEFPDDDDLNRMVNFISQLARC